MHHVVKQHDTARGRRRTARMGNEGKGQVGDSMEQGRDMVELSDANMPQSQTELCLDPQGCYGPKHSASQAHSWQPVADCVGHTVTIPHHSGTSCTL